MRGPARPRLRALDQPRPVEVEADPLGIPLRVVLPDSAGGRKGRVHSIESVRETWRIDDEWWRDPLTRRYHSVVLDTGGCVVLYEDLTEGTWYVHR